MGHREWLDVSGPVIASHGIVPRTTDMTHGSWQTVTLPPAASAAEAIRQGSALSL